MINKDCETGAGFRLDLPSRDQPSKTNEMLVELALCFAWLSPSGHPCKGARNQPDCMLNRRKKPIRRPAQTAVMFFPISKVRLEIYDAIPQWGVRGTCSPKVSSGSLRNEHKLPASGLESFAPIDILCIEEEALVKPSHIVHRGTPGHPETSAEVLRPPRGSRRPTVGPGSRRRWTNQGRS